MVTNCSSSGVIASGSILTEPVDLVVLVGLLLLLGLLAAAVPGVVSWIDGRGDRHVGQLCDRFCHSAIHREWNLWLQGVM